MRSIKFGCVKLLILLVLGFLVASIHSETYYYPSGLSQMTRVGKRLMGSPDQWNRHTDAGNKRYKITNFPRIGRSLKSYPEDGDQGKEMWFGSRLGNTVYPKINKNMDEPACVTLNDDNPTSQLGYYNQQQDVIESDPLLSEETKQLLPSLYFEQQTV